MTSASQQGQRPCITRAVSSHGKEWLNERQMGNPSQSYTRSKWTRPTLTPARQAGTRFSYPRGMEGWVGLGGWLHTKMVYPPTDSHTVTHQVLTRPNIEQLCCSRPMHYC